MDVPRDLDGVVDEVESTSRSQLLELVRWWERRRPWYNLTVGVAGSDKSRGQCLPNRIPERPQNIGEQP
jgi:hypothetical protein